MDTSVDRLKFIFLVNLSILCMLGVVMVYSSSYIYSMEKFDSSYYVWLKHLIFLGLGIGTMILIAKCDANSLYRYLKWAHYFSLILLGLTLVPGIGVNVKGASRWFHVAGIQFQPSEFIKITTLSFLVHFVGEYRLYSKVKLFSQTSFLILPMVLLLFQPDFGSFSVILMGMVLVGFLSPLPRKFFYSGVGFSVIALTTLIFTQEYRIRRFLSFLDPWKDPQGSGFQIIQSFLAFANGHWFGVGLGESNEKLFYLPEAHNDFIFSVLAEEQGFIGVLVAIFLFFAMGVFGFKIAKQASTYQWALVISGMVFILVLQAALNMGVVLGLLPTKGLNIPFLSVGGSSLLANFMAVGIILSLSRPVDS